MTAYQFTVWKRKMEKEKRRKEKELDYMRSGIAKFYQKVW
ncbi:hypothetical protein J2T14_004564 [Paenibacillus harenae]|nr:hypothetical protein [Paenibacillus harenae]